jgi:glycosyltransferase involved in cell wall biosynthesis
MCEGICEAMVAAGHEVDVVTTAMGDLPALEERRGVVLHRVPCARRHRHYTTSIELLTTLVPMYRKAAALQRARAYDLMHCHFVLPSGLPAWWLSCRTGLPYVITCHGSDVPGYNPDRFGWEHRLLAPIWSRVVRGAAAVTSPSRYLAELVRRRTETAVEIIPYGFDAPALPECERRNRILVATRMFERKGVQFVLRALARLEGAPEVWIAGDGPYLPQLRGLASELGVRVRFLGQLPREELIRLYPAAKVFVLPSLSENFPVVLLEALAAGCAVVTSDSSGCREVVGEAAVTVPPGDADALARELASLLADDARVARLGKRARERVERFSWSNVAGMYEDLYRRCLGPGAPRRGAAQPPDRERELR